MLNNSNSTEGVFNKKQVFFPLQRSNFLLQRQLIFYALTSIALYLYYTYVNVSIYVYICVYTFFLAQKYIIHRLNLDFSHDFLHNEDCSYHTYKSTSMFFDRCIVVH